VERNFQHSSRPSLPCNRCCVFLRG